MPYVQGTAGFPSIEVRSGGDDLNGGAYNRFRSGATVDKSLSNTPAYVYTDLVMGAMSGSAATVSSAARPFQADDVGNYLRFDHTAAGASAAVTAYRYEITSVSGGVATIAIATGAAWAMPAVAGTTGITARLGGAVKTIQEAVQRTSVSAFLIWVKDDGVPHDYTSTTGPSSTAVSGGNTNGSHAVRGYGTTRGDNVRPTIRAAVNNAIALTRWDGTSLRFTNLIFDGGSLQGITGARAMHFNNNQGSTFWRCEFRNFSGTNPVQMSGPAFYECTFRDCAMGGGSQPISSAQFCAFINCTGTSANGVFNGGNWVGNIFHRCSNTGYNPIIRMQGSHMVYIGNIMQGVSKSATQIGVATYNNFTTGYQLLQLFANNVFLSCGIGIIHYAGNNWYVVQKNNVFADCTTAIDNGASENYTDDTVVLANSPFVDAVNGNYALNPNIPEYALVTDRGWPATPPGLPDTALNIDPGWPQNSAAPFEGWV